MPTQAERAPLPDVDWGEVEGVVCDAFDALTRSR
jgi:hypothetical protein